MRILMNQGLLLRSESAFLYTFEYFENFIYDSAISEKSLWEFYRSHNSLASSNCPAYKPQLAYVLEFEHSISSKVLSLIKLNRL